MALIKCEDCGKDVSTKAKACPNCGCPMVGSEGDLITEYHQNGNKKEEGRKIDNKEQGLWKSWHENGNKSWFRHYQNGELHGQETTWYEGGQKESERNYSNGQENGLLTAWFENGQKELSVIYKDDEIHGNSTEWFENGQKKEESLYDKGKIVSAMSWKPNGQMCPETNVKDGEGCLVSYDLSGSKASQASFKDGKDHGLKLEWWENGKLFRQAEYRNGKDHGIEIEWRENGTKYGETPYKDGNIHGITKNWNDNGQLFRQAEYRNGKQHGLETWWNEGGEKYQEITYENGVKIKHWEKEKQNETSNINYEEDSANTDGVSPKLLWFIGVSVVCFIFITIIIEGHNNTMSQHGGEQLGIGFCFIMSLVIGAISAACIPSGNSGGSYTTADQYRAISAVQREQQRRELGEINDELDDISDHFEH